MPSLKALLSKQEQPGAMPAHHAARTHQGQLQQAGTGPAHPRAAPQPPVPCQVGTPQPAIQSM